MGKINSFTKIKALYPEMTNAEKNIADFILNNSEEIYTLKIQDLAKKSDVSLPTVFRFAKRLGFQGNKDFKIELIRDMGVSFHISPDGMEEDSVEGITNTIFEKEINNFQETLSNINYAEIKNAVQAIKGARRVIFFAVSSSLPVAFDFFWKFTFAGFSCFYNSDIYTQRIISSQCTKNDTAIGISFSGSSLETVNCLKTAKQNGAKTICVTTFIESPVTEYSDIKLFTAPVRSIFQKVDLPSKISQTAILDVLYLLVVLQNRERATRYISMSEKELLRYRK